MEYIGINVVNGSYLSHYGILGMKWGVRRYQPYSVKPRKSGESGKEMGLAKKIGKKASKTVKDTRKKAYDYYNEPNRKATRERKKQAIKDRANRYNLSDGDLEKKINRLKKEQELKRLTDEQITPGRTYVKGLLKSTGKNVASKLTFAGALYGGKKILEKKFGVDIAAQIYAYIKKK